MALTQKQILQADDLPREAVDVPEWGGTVFVRMMTATELDVYRDGIMKAEASPDSVTLRAGLVARCLVGDNGDRLFSDDEIDALGGKASIVLERLTEATLKINGMTADDVEELAKN